MNKTLRKIFFAIFSLFALTVILMVLVVYSGYKIDYKHFRLVKTGSLYINTNPQKADIYLNGKKISQKTPTIINQLNPDIYNLKIIKNGYQEWEQQVKIEPSITSFVNYDLVLKDIELSPTNEFGENIYYSSDNKYIAYTKEDTLNKENVLYIYNVASKNEFNIFKTENKIKNIVWSQHNTRLLLNINDELYILDISRIPVINKISASDLVKLSNYLENIDNVYWNKNNDSKVLLRSENKLYYFDIDSKNIEIVKENFDKDIIFINNNIYYINNNKIVKEKVLDDSYYEYDLPADDIKRIEYLNNNFVLFGDNNIYISKELNKTFTKVLGNNVEIDKNFIISWNDYELNVYDIKEKDSKFAIRYSQKIVDLEFCLKNYIILVLENDIKIINLGDNVNEIDIMSDIKNISKVIATDNKTIYVIYKEDEQNMISNIELQ